MTQRTEISHGYEFKIKTLIRIILDAPDQICERALIRNPGVSV